ncbi:phage major capsid protein [Hansschlegelia beijingensis]|uniref:Phage capsid-like C-terminal domain-containing protein n=1 Tax=Hansschlegelia beijingensis TaxID=1133344 RepID=A0A7W6CYA9_9HYPH|nr:phage major capsid protein [Hansschlegelia beijingensis]MBB3972517.1 hypothetical protein [Hansschlegelia beijingensis]
MNALTQTVARYDMEAKSQDFVRYAIACAMSGGDSFQIRSICETRWPEARYGAVIQKAAVEAGDTTDATWAKPLAELAPVADAFLAAVRPRTLIGRMAGIRPAPFGVRFPVATSGTSAGWVGEAKPTPVTAMAFGEGTLKPAKVGGIVVTTKELLRSTSPEAEAQIKLDLETAIITFTDAQFVDPTVAAVDDVNPASITNGTTAVAASGTTAAAATADFKALVKKLTDAGIPLASPYFLMSPTAATGLAGLNVEMFRDVGPLGGSIMGIPVLTSPGVGSVIALVDATEIILADDGIVIDAAEHGSVQMDSAPTDPPTASTVLTSFFQSNLVGIKALRQMRWQKRRAGAAAYISGAAYGG